MGASGGHELLQLLELSQPDSRVKVAQPVVIAHVGMVEFISWISGLVDQDSPPVKETLVLRDYHASSTACDGFVAIEAQAAQEAKDSHMLPLIGGAQTLCGVLNQRQTIFFGDGQHRVHIYWVPVQVDHYYSLHLQARFSVNDAAS